MTAPPIKPGNDGEDAVAAFQIDGQPIRGRVLRLGQALDGALRGHDYPESVARILGEAAMVAALVARSLKFDGRLLIQCHGTNEGAVSLIVADCSTSGHLRAYARYNDEALARLLEDDPRPDAVSLIGKGTFSMTIDQGADMDRYQGLSAIEGGSLAACAEHYFAQSEQIPTRIKLSVGQIQKSGQEATWRGGAMMIQQIAGDRARGETAQAWETTSALFHTLTDAELLDPDLSSHDILYRLFHEDGVRLMEAQPIMAKCGCSRERLVATLGAFEKSERESMFEQGEIKAKCDFCGTDYAFTPDDFG